MSGIRDDTSTVAIDQAVELLEHRLPDQNLVSEDERLVQRVTTVDFWLFADLSTPTSRPVERENTLAGARAGLRPAEFFV